MTAAGIGDQGTGRAGRQLEGAAADGGGTRPVQAAVERQRAAVAQCAAGEIERAVEGGVGGGDAGTAEVGAAIDRRTAGEAVRAGIELNAVADDVEHTGVCALGRQLEGAGARIDGAAIQIVEACEAGEAADAAAAGLGQSAAVVEVAATAGGFADQSIAGEVEAAGVVQHAAIVEQQGTSGAGVVDGAGIVQRDAAEREVTAAGIGDQGTGRAGEQVQPAPGDGRVAGHDQTARQIGAATGRHRQLRTRRQRQPALQQRIRAGQRERGIAERERIAGTRVEPGYRVGATAQQHA